MEQDRPFNRLRWELNGRNGRGLNKSSRKKTFQRNNENFETKVYMTLSNLSFLREDFSKDSGNGLNPWIHTYAPRNQSVPSSDS